jgi:hypothetical protein
MSKLENSLDAVCNKETFLMFLSALAFDCNSNLSNWENKTLGSYLEGMHGWVEDVDLNNFYKEINVPEIKESEINWRVFADILISGTMYE